MSDTVQKTPSIKAVGIAIGIAIVGAVAAFWMKHSAEQGARHILVDQYEAVVEIDPDTKALTIAIADPELTDLADVGPLLKKAGRVIVLDLTGCDSLVSLSGLGNASQIESLIGIGLPALASIAGIEELTQLRELILVECTSLSDVSALTSLVSVNAVDLSGAMSLSGSITLGGKPYLTDLNLSECPSLESVSLGAVPYLHALYLNGCAKLTTVTDLESAATLTDVDFSNTHALRSIAGLEKLSELHLVDLRNCAAPDVMEIAGKCHPVKILRLGGQAGLENFEALTALENLMEFHYDASSSLTSLAGLPVKSLTYCGVPNCPELVDIDALAGAKQLRHLDLSGATRLSELGPLADLPELQEVNLTGCRAVRDLIVFEKTPALAVLQLGGTSAPRPQISKLQKLFPTTIFDFSGR